MKTDSHKGSVNDDIFSLVSDFALCVLIFRQSPKPKKGKLIMVLPTTEARTRWSLSTALLMWSRKCQSLLIVVLYTQTQNIFAWDIMMVDDCSPYEKQTNIEIDIFFKNLSMASVIGENKNPRDLKVYTKIALVRNARSSCKCFYWNLECLRYY